MTSLLLVDDDPDLIAEANPRILPVSRGGWSKNQREILSPAPIAPKTDAGAVNADERGRQRPPLLRHDPTSQPTLLGLRIRGFSGMVEYAGYLRPAW